jgi:hypothetical protein
MHDLSYRSMAGYGLAFNPPTALALVPRMLRSAPLFGVMRC